MIENSLDTRVFPFFNKQGTEYIYSGLSGLILEYDELVKEAVSESGKASDEIYDYIFSDPFVNTDFTFFEEEPFIDTLTIFTTNQCNLNCSYCFEKVNQIDKSLRMDIKTFRDGINFFISNFTYDSVINIAFFGGEPLLNFHFMKEAVDFLEEIEKRNKVKFTYCVTTNGTLLNQKEIADFLISNDFNVTISIDGNQKEHDKNRHFLNGNGSYQMITQNVKELSKYMDITARTTITSPHTDFVALYEDLHSTGVKGIILDFVSAKDKYKKEDYEALAENLKAFADYCIDNIKQKKVIRIKNFLETLHSIHYGSRNGPKYFPCEAGVSYYSLVPGGDIYPCHRFNNVKEYWYGNIYESFNNDRRREFSSSHMVFVRNAGKCMDCWAKYLCGGTCYNAAYYSEGDSILNSEIHCDFKREIIKSCLYIYASLNENDRVFLDNIL
ncbi:uncharacterized protein DFR58_14310 [Anaerobacterium chartisolvens]|uniref:Radical SAM core domain-containing protein n=1 Tax=Anaerobacterium chartisolvens TaxID=1297424 RepID=A0A369AIY3_9FIRM|nr:radical SAM protein [Anaerobacterium chartisolvens]RCX08298.1 uncharacterized protein DFR58_14310 [Anaerobacterium chartisolvens]